MLLLPASGPRLHGRLSSNVRRHKHLRCEHCDRTIWAKSSRCPLCGRSQLPVGKLAAADGLLTQMSMGRHQLTRLFGNIFVAANALFVMVALFRALRYGNEDDDSAGALIFSAFLGYCTYEVWAFTHGRPTSIDHYRHEATPDRTGWRVFGLTLDVAFWFLCTRFLKSW